MDVGLFGPLKHYYTSLLQEQREHLGHGAGIQNADFYSLFMQAQALALTKSNIQKAFAASGMWPFDRQQV